MSHGMVPTPSASPLKVSAMTSAARLLFHLAMPASATTLLRAIRDLPLPSGTEPHVVGADDDWALRKGRTHGTIVVDLERRRPIDLPPDRSAATLADWL